MALTHGTGAETGCEGQLSAPNKSISRGRAGRAEWVAGIGDMGGFPSLQAMASFPSSTQTAAGTGWGSS